MTTEQMVTEFLAKGGVVKIGKTRKFRPQSFIPARQRGAIAAHGRKAQTLRDSGFAKAS